MKKLIIVCEEKCRQYGDYLAQLISLEDDTEDETVGTKDGEVAAQVWLEKDYKANAAQLSSNQYILFIGQDKDKVKERIAWYCDTTNTIDYELNPDFDSDSFLFAFEDTDMNDHQKEIVAQLWGIYTGKPMSKKEVAENMGVTYNRIRQVEICCLRHILRNRNRNTLIIEK